MFRRNWLIGIVFVALGMALFVFTEPERAHAAPSAPLAGSFTVNSGSDNTTKDGSLTLREAILIANGGTGGDGVGTGLGRTLSDGEKAQINASPSTCAFGGSTGSWTITGGCGDGIADTIYFNVYPGVTLLSYLPVINDTAPTTIIGNLGTKPYPVINASLIGSHRGLRISSNNNQIYNLTIQGAPLDDFYIDGNYNLLHEVRAWSAGSNGINLIGDHNTVESSQIGFDPYSSDGCAVQLNGNSFFGIYLTSGSQYNTIQNTDIGCNSFGGIDVQYSATPTYHTLGPNNRIGYGPQGARPNYSDGIIVEGNSASVVTSTIVYNTGDGIYVTGNNNSVYGNTVQGNSQSGMKVSGSTNSIYGNVVDSNTGDGVQISMSGSGNMLGCITNCLFGGGIVGNIVTNNAGNGIVISSTTSANYVMGNRVGNNGGGGSAPNLKSGILIYNSSGNFIGDGLSPLFKNLISFNSWDGIRLDNNASSNSIANNSIYMNGTHGVRLMGGAHDNTIGGATSAYSNTLFSNTLDGVYISSDSNTVSNNSITFNSVDGIYINSGDSNVVDSNLIAVNTNGIHLTGSSAANVIGTYTGGVQHFNYIYSNTADGITIDSTANNNLIRNNYIGIDAAASPSGNSGNGISVYGSAHDNAIGDGQGYSYIKYNGFNGIVLSGASVTNNQITHNWAQQNQQNGLLIASAHHNVVNSLDGCCSISNANRFNDNLLNGVLLSSGAHDNSINFNWIYDNHHNGVEFTDSGTINNVISRTLIFNNLMDGVNERNSASKNSWTVFSSYGNHGLGIDKAATSDTSNAINGPFPIVTSVVASGGTVTVNGTASPSWMGTSSTTVEMYIVDINPLGFAEGKTYRGNAQAGFGDGAWSISFSGTSVGCYIAFQTIHDFASDAYTSSEFGPSSCRLYLPLIKR